MTGEARSKRQLYEDTKLIVQRFRRAVILTSIHPGDLPGDLARRIMTVEPRLRSMGDEVEIWAAYEDARPRIFGALLNPLCDVLGELPTVKVEGRLLMRDAARIFAAVDRCAGTSALEAYRSGIEEMTERAGSQRAGPLPLRAK